MPQVLPVHGEGDRAQRGGGGPATLRRPEVDAARRARRAMSLPEILLWQRLKGSPRGIAFRKQHPIGDYRADFYCAAAKLVIEVDGIAHDMGDRPARDEARTPWLERKGYRIVRIPAADVLKDAVAVAEAIVALASPPPPPRPAGAVPLPVNGEDLREHQNPPRSRGGGGAIAPTEGGQPNGPASQP